LSKVPRKDESLEEVLDLLDMRLARAENEPRVAWASLTSFESEFINGEILKCTDFRYYAENYHVIGSEEEGFKTLWPFWDSQEIFYEKILSLQQNKLPAKVIVLKARQLGLSTVSQALIFHKTIFREGCNTLVVAQDPGQADYLFNMARTAYDSLPWWMRPEARYEAKGRYLVFDRKDPMERLVNPGLKSQIFVEAANKMSGVAVGRTVHAAHLSEISNWDNDAVLAEEIFPTMNATDELAIMESTARGRKNFWHTFWEASWKGKTQWTPVFIEFFRVKKYSMPIPAGVEFKESKEEIGIREKVKQNTGIVISNEQFYWRRKKMEEFSALQGNEYKFYQEYPQVSWVEAFQGSGVCAFNRKKLQSILETMCCDPLWYGEIDLEIKGEKRKPRLRLVELYDKDKDGKFTSRNEDVKLPPQEEWGSRFYVWEQPSEGEAYYLGVDVAHGVPGGDFSVVQVLKIGHAQEPDTQVAEWRGWINPGPFGHVVCAIGYWYNEAQISIECNDVGQATNAEVMRIIQYENLFRWKHYDKVKNFITDYFGWFTSVKTRPLIIAKFREFMDDKMIVIRSEWLIDECLDFSSQDGSRFEGQATNDDRVMAMMIGLFCAHDSEWGMEAASQPKRTPEELKNARMQDFANSEFSPVYDANRPGKMLPYDEERKIPKDFMLHNEVYNAENEAWKLL
jgi:hypothetical protein